MPNTESKTHQPTTSTRRGLKSRGKLRSASSVVAEGAAPAKVSQGVHKYTTAKIVLLGGAVSGKSALFLRLASDFFDEATPTQIQHVILSMLRTEREDGTVCEPVLWDLPSHPDHQLVHALFLEDTDLAIVVFDPTGQPSPFQPAEYWLKVLTRRKNPCLAILVAGRVDRGHGALTPEETRDFCKRYKVAGDCIPTSALTGHGISDLTERIRANLAWDKKQAIVVTTTFEWIKQCILGLKENVRLRKVLLTPAELEKRLRAFDRGKAFEREEMMDGVRQLANMGIVMVLRSEAGDEFILIKPDLLIEVAKNFVDHARRNRKGLGALSLRRVREGEYEFLAIKRLKREEQQILLAATSELFIESSVCFTAFDDDETYLVFPALIRLKKPQVGEVQTEEDATYVVKGAVESIYSILVVLLGYTRWFKRTNQWENEAQYELPSQIICGFRQIAEREGEMHLVLYYGPGAGEAERNLFEANIELFFKNRDVTTVKYPAVRCPRCDYRQERTAVMRRLAEGKDFIRCDECSENIKLEKAGKSVGMSQTDKKLVEAEKRRTERRPRFTSSVTRLTGLKQLREALVPKKPRCFISYAWGVDKDEAWVRTMAKDLADVGVDAVIDVRDNADPGSSVSRFISTIKEHDHIIVVGTPRYMEKYENNDEGAGSKLAAEMDIIGNRLTGNEERKRTVIPVILHGSEEKSLPALLQGRVYVDFCREEDYFPSLFRLVVKLYGMSSSDAEVEELIKLMDAQT